MSKRLQVILDDREMKEIRMDELADFGVRSARRTTTECDDARHSSIEQALAHDSLPDHARGAEDEHVHARSLTTSALRA